MNSLLDQSKYSSRLKKSTTMISTNRSLKNPSNSKKTSQTQTRKKVLEEMNKELKKKQEKLISLEDKNLGLVQLNRTLIDDFKQNQSKSNSVLVKKYEEKIRYLKESQQELFQESCEQKQQIKLLQKKIENYLEGNIEEKHILRDYYNGYFNDRLHQENSKNQRVIKDLMKENDDLKHLLQESNIKRRDSLCQLQENYQSSKKNINALTNLLSPSKNELRNNDQTENKNKGMSFFKERKMSYQQSPNIYNHGSESQFEIYQRMTSQMSRLENNINKFNKFDNIRVSNKTQAPETCRYDDKLEKKKNWRNTQDDIIETLRSMKKELKLLDENQ